uniref:rRNA methyltransferase 2, mitochondrial n=1 Tax=Caligus rogercresseyi TaxID=217165 RepID=C1BPC9_CALRO|nr:ribosomal RNA methyltransferase CG11447 [Caligus rogercresseyi]
MNCCGSERLVQESFSLIFTSGLKEAYDFIIEIGVTVGIVLIMGIGLRWSSSWIRRQAKDIYVKKARSEGYRARSAYKLLEMDDKLKILRPNMNVMECGGAPGAWTQVLTERVSSGTIISCDLLDYEPVGRAIILPNSDFTSPSTQDTILSHLGKSSGFDLVLSDMAPNASGMAELNHGQILNLSYEATKFALRHSKPEAAF